MKKVILGLLLAAGVTFAGTNAYAVPVINGALGAGEWSNLSFNSTPYPYYLEIFDVNEASVPDAFDIKHVVLFQELTSHSGDGNFANDGIYLLIETFSPTTMADPNGGALPWPTIALSGDFNGDGSYEFFANHYATLPTGIPASQKVSVTNLAGFPAPIFGADLVGSGGAFSPATGLSSVLEYYFPAGTFGTPPSPPGTPFPVSFIGSITFDNGGEPADDIATGRLAVTPEPASVMLFATGILGMLGVGRKFWN